MAVLLGNPASATADLDKVSVQVAQLLERMHYSRQRLDDEVSQKLLEQYLTSLDPNKLFFTAADVNGFEARFGTALDDAIRGGNLDPAREIFAVYKQRVTDRIAKNIAFAESDVRFDSDETVALDRRELDWPKDEAEADELWRKRITAELLQEDLNEHAEDTPTKLIVRRQNQLLRNVDDMDDESVVSEFLSSLAKTYDPHSEYLSPSALANFEIEMKKSLDGVGAVLQSEDGYAKVKEVVPGGPADMDGRLRVNDRIAAVAQGDNEFEDVVDMKLDKVVERIRGRRGTIVRLQVIPASATDGAERSIITIRRDEVQLKEQKAKAEILDIEGTGDGPMRIGWIELPSFYADLGSRDSNSVSTTRDVSALIERLKSEGIEGLVIDLRRDGGGSLEEAINLTGLFIPEGPVVQAKDSNGQVRVSVDDDTSVAYSGPLVVLMNRLSASASEIFAAALQDYGRAVIVGDERSFGKGTVQTMLDIGRFMPFFSLGSEGAGALKLTVQKFYRVKGGSTQLEGVASDIVIPSLTDNPEIGESALTNPLAYDEVAPERIRRVDVVSTFLPELRARAEQRINSDPEFTYVLEDLERVRQRIESNSVSINRAERLREREEDDARSEARKAERAERGPAIDAVAYEVTLEDVDAPELRKVDFDRKKKKDFAAMDEEEAKEEEEILPDAVRNETLRIVCDLVELSKLKKTAAVIGNSSKGKSVE